MSTSPTSSPHATAQLDAFDMRASTITGAALIGVLGAGLASCGLLLSSGRVELLPATFSRDEALHGELTHQLAKQLSQADFPEHAARLERAGSWLLLRDTGPRVRKGCEDWLFLTDELKVNRHAQGNAAVKVEAVIGVQQRLREQGIALLVAVVPDKSRIATDQLCGLQRPTMLAQRANAWVATLDRAGVPALNLEPALQPLGSAAWLRTDTHWSQSGAHAAAQAIAQAVQDLGIRATPHKEFETHTEPADLRPGDLVRLAGLDWLPLNWQPAADMVAATQTRERQDDAAHARNDDLDDLFGDDNLPNVTLIGTSFSRNSNFVGFLQMALGAPVGNFARDGGGFSGGANQYFNNPAFWQTPPRLVIWEIPERDLQTPYEPIKWEQ